MLAKNPMAEAHSILEIAMRAEVTIVDIDERRPPLAYDLGDGENPDWYLVQTFAGEDTRAFRWLARRGFGVFQPMMQRKVRKTGLLVQGKEPMFPGWLFVYCRDIKRNGPRIRRCPGVYGILSDLATEQPVPIDQPELSEDRMSCTYPRVGFVDKLRAWSEVYNPRAPHAHCQSNHAVRGQRNIKRTTRRLTPKERKNLERMTCEVKKRDIWDEDQWEQVMKLDPGARIAVLMATIKGASDVGHSVKAER